MKKIVILGLIIAIASCSSLKKLGIEPTLLETTTALKEVLNSSAFRAVKTLRKIDENGVDGLLPPEIMPVLQSLKTVGLGKEIESIEKIVESTSKLMADESEIILEDAIKEVTFKDAVAIVIGGKNEATNVLKQAMYGSVKNRYRDKIEKELAPTEATKYWPIAANAYNVFAKKKVGVSLPDFMAERAVDALFLTMKKEEEEIRKDPKQLGKTVVTKVFEYYQKSQKGKGIKIGQ